MPIQKPEPKWMSILRIVTALLALVPEIVIPIVKERENATPDIKTRDDNDVAAR